MEFVPPPLRGQTVVHLRYAYSGTYVREGERLLAPMKDAGRVLLGFVGPIRTDEMDSIHMDPVDPMPAWEKGMLLDRPARGGGRRAARRRRAAGGHPADHGRDPADGRGAGPAGAVPNAVPGRDGAFSMYVIGPGVPELAEVVPAVGRGVLGALAPWKAAELDGQLPR